MKGLTGTDTQRAGLGVSHECPLWGRRLTTGRVRQLSLWASAILSPATSSSMVARMGAMNSPYSSQLHLTPLGGPHPLVCL